MHSTCGACIVAWHSVMFHLILSTAPCLSFWYHHSFKKKDGKPKTFNIKSSLFHWQTLWQLQQVRRHETNADVEEKTWSLVDLKQSLGQTKSKNKNSPYKGWWRSVWSLCLYFWRNFSARSAASGMSGWLATALLTTCSEKTRTVISYVQNIHSIQVLRGKNKQIKPIFTLMQITS